MHVSAASVQKTITTHAGRGAWTPPKTRADLATTTVAASDPRVGPPRTVVSLTRKNFHTCDTRVRGGQLSGHLRRRSWWLIGHPFSGVSMLHGQHEPPLVSHMVQQAHAPDAHPGCYLQRIRNGCGVDGADFDTTMWSMATESATSKLPIR
jgi:hypothetical protein